MAEVKVPIKLELLLDEALKDAKQASTAISKQLESVGSNASSIAGIAKAFGAFAVAGIAVDAVKALAGSIGDFVKEAADAERVTAGLSNALKLTGDFTQESVDGFKELADQLASVTKFDDDLILSQVKIAKQFNTSNKEATKLVTAATELATVLDVDLTTATQLLGKTLDGTAGRLTEQVPQLKKFSKEALVSGAAIDFVLKRFGGSARSDLDTFSGALAQVGKAQEDLGKSIGRIVTENEIFKNILQITADVLKSLSSALDDNSGAIKALINAGLKTLVDLFGILIQTLSALDSILTASLIPLNIFARTIQFILGGLFSLLTLDLKGLASNLNIIGNVTSDNRAQAAALKERVNFYDKITDLAARASNSIADQNDNTSKVLQNDKARNKTLNENANAQERLNDALKDDRKNFIESISKFGLNSVQQLTLEQDKLLKKNFELFRSQNLAQNKYLSNEYDIRLEYEKKIAEERNKLIQESLSKVEELTKNPFKGAFGPDQAPLDAATGNATGRAVGIAGNVLQGRQGAVTAISGAAEAFGRSIGIPGLGQLATLLSQGPEQVKAFVKEFIRSVPQIIVAIVESIPAVIDALIEELPNFISALIAAIPRIIVAAFNSSLIVKAVQALFSDGFKAGLAQFFNGAGRFIDELVKGAGEFIQRLIDGIGEGISKLFDGLNPFSGSNSGVGGLIGGIGNVIGNIGGAIGSVFGFKTGGVSDGGGFSKSSGSQFGFQSSQPMVVKVQVGQRELAQAMLDINRQGFRTA